MEKQYYISKEQYITLLAKWKEHNHHSAAQHIIYNLLRSKDPATGFTERTKNIQGNDPWFGYNSALSSLTYTYFRYIPFPRYSDEEFKKKFKEDFGIDMPEGLWEKLKECKK